MEENRRKETIILVSRVAVAAILVILGRFFLTEEKSGLLINAIILGLAWIIVSYDVLWKAIKGIFRIKNEDGEKLPIFNEFLLMSIASIGAFMLRFFGPDHNEFSEGVLVMLLYQIGEFFQDLAEDKSKDAITDALDLRKEKAIVEYRPGKYIEKKPEDIKIGDILVLGNGQKLLCDGVVVEGNAAFDESSLTGEALPKGKTIGEAAYSGTTVVFGSCKIKGTTLYEDSTVVKLQKLVEESANKKSKATAFIEKFAAIYTPIVMGIALLVAFLPPLFLGINQGEVWSRWIYSGLCFLVIACPCAMVISIPLSCFAGLGLASKNGIIVKGAEYYDKLAVLKTAYFDKTGTLTTGKLIVNLFKPIGIEETLLKQYLITAESRSSHPIGLSIVEYLKGVSVLEGISKYKEIPGEGIYFEHKKNEIFVGKIDEKELSKEGVNLNGISVGVYENKKLVGIVQLQDEVRMESVETVEFLHKEHVNCGVLSGDSKPNVLALSSSLRLDEAHYSLKPEDKVALIEKRIEEKDGSVIFVGDGINDGAAIVRSDVGIVMGSLGSDIAVANADVILMRDDPSQVISLIKIARKTRRRNFVNLSVALGVKVIVMILSVVLKEFPLWLAVLSDTGLTLALVLFSITLLWSRVKK